MKNNDSEGQHDDNEKQDEEYAGQDNIREHTFHNMIHKGINNIIVKPFSDFFLADVL